MEDDAVLDDLKRLRGRACFLGERIDLKSLDPESEELDIEVAPDGEEGVGATGAIVLRAASVERLQGVSQVPVKSAVLAHYEERVATVFDRVEPLVGGMQRGRRRRIGSRELLRQIGDVMLAQTRTVARVEVTERPEIVWDRPELDRLYERLSAEYELRDRDLALTRKLDLISRTAQTFLDLLQHRRSLHVEWYIVILIVVEIVLSLYGFLSNR